VSTPRHNRLVTIPISHFCEKARWALDRAGVDYVEHRHLQVLHVAAARRAGGGRTVPVLVTESGEVLPESSAILRWADDRTEPDRRLYPGGALGEEAAALEERLDERLGPDGRLWMYEQTLPIVREMAPWVLAGVPRGERLAFRAGGPLITHVVRRYLGVDAAAAATALTRIDAVFDEIASRLSDERPFLLGERFTAADLTFAALAAPVLVPAGYGAPLPPAELMPTAMATEVERLRAHPAGQFAASLYATQRPRAAEGAELH
jgi:glutathione S-transferase